MGLSSSLSPEAAVLPPEVVDLFLLWDVAVVVMLLAQPNHELAVEASKGVKDRAQAPYSYHVYLLQIFVTQDLQRSFLTYPQMILTQQKPIEREQYMQSIHIQRNLILRVN